MNAISSKMKELKEILIEFKQKNRRKWIRCKQNVESIDAQLHIQSLYVEEGDERDELSSVGK